MVFMVAPITSSPWPLSTGIGSPVSIDSSTAEPPPTTTPSTGTFSPGRTTHEVAGHDLGHRHVGLAAVAQHAGRLGLQADERADGQAGLPLGARLQHAAEEDERDDEGGRVEVHRRAQAVMGEEAGEEHAGGAVDVGRRRAHGDERVHVRGGVAGGRPGAAVELGADPELHRRGQRPQEPAVVHEAGQEGKPVAHAAQEDDHREGGADDDLGLEAAVLGAARRRLRVHRRLRVRLGCAAVGRGGRLGYVVARLPHGRRQRRVRSLAGQVVDGRPLGGQVHVGAHHAGHGPERLLDAQRAGGASHAQDGQDVRGLLSHTA